MTRPNLTPRRGNLRAVADRLERATPGLHIEIIGGALVMSPAPRGKHAGIILILEQEIRPALLDSLVAIEVAAVEMPDDPDDYVIPDLTVCPADFVQSDEWLLDPADVELAVEVISPSERSKGVADKADWYAVAGVRCLLLIDPRSGTWVLRSHPDGGQYQGTRHGKFGESVPLPAPLGFEISTDSFPFYGETPGKA
ncbi:hypothetical protein SRB5_70870 [Streptomyces sp. RB5]|uniref:Putative restriction endonuclease domain-containing protein n=1 Tax=Streptomyces smaragdinus TaxID=2585196 RepID=A0A7K0CW47_9ACTN|nr:Uma2 family endonuclease [Streptomyces smaragdinus]MQY16884.1 hypothetical protein [Streptomyces smaragdinus]